MIANAEIGERRHTDARIAKAYVASGKAKWVPGKEGSAIVVCRVRARGRVEDRSPDELGYDEAVHFGKVAPLGEIFGLPVLMPVKLITDPSKSPRKVRSKWERNGPVKWTRFDLPEPIAS
jgi:hypothetical protein